MSFPNLKYIADPLFWIALLSAVISLGLYLINKRTFALLYEKPKIVISKILLKRANNVCRDCHIDIDLFNPSSSKNLIIRAKILSFPFCKTVEDVKANIIIPASGRSSMLLSLGNETVSKYKNKMLMVVLTDIKGKHPIKLFNLEEKTA